MTRMFILDNVPLSTLSTMRLGGPAAYMSEVNNRQDIKDACEWASKHKVPVMMIGQGSNIIWSDDGFPGLVLVNKIQGYEIFEEDKENVYLTVGGGEEWDGVVKRSVEAGYSGIEQLSLIPGTAGATPIQNVGAYGREIADVLITIEAYDVAAKKFMTIRASDCDFGYRTSRFKTTDKNKYLISAITLHLTTLPPLPPFYSSVEQYLEDHGITNVTSTAVREAVIAIRSSKLPDPVKVANTGSFFHNPIVDNKKAMLLVKAHIGIPHWRLEDGRVKLSAAWLIEQAGFKDYHDEQTGMATWPHQSLVFVNEKARSTADLMKFKANVVEKVNRKFGIELRQEPESIG